MLFVVPPSARCPFSPVWLCWHFSLFLVDRTVASLPRPLPSSLSFGCCALRRVPLVLRWAVCRAEVPAVPPRSSPRHPHGHGWGGGTTRPSLQGSVASTRPTAKLGSTGVDHGPWRAGCVHGSTLELRAPPASSGRGGMGHLVPLSRSLGIAWGGRTMSLLFLWWVEGLNLGRKAKMEMLSRANRGSSCSLLAFLSSGIRVAPQLYISSSSKGKTSPVCSSRGSGFPGATGLARTGSFAARALIVCSQPLSSSAFRGPLLFFRVSLGPVS